MINNITRNKTWQWLLIVTLLCVFTLPVQAAIPDNVDYQGYLTDSGGSPINGTVSITFSLYNTQTGPIALWSDTYTVVDVSNGLFNIKLGRTGSPFPLGLFDAPLWLGIEVAGDGEMTPRITISSAAFAHKADDALTLEGQSASSLDQSAHVTDTTNPHGITAAQIGAVSSADFTLHTGDASAHHTKTTTFTDLTDQASDAQLPASITRDSELLTHAGNASAHHTKTSSFTELSGQAADAQLPAAIARDAEIMPTVLAGDGSGSTLDADLLDGLDSSAFMSSGTDNWVNINGDTMTGNLNVLANVGIGTVTPGYRLDVRGGVSDYLAFFYNVNNTSGSGAAKGISAVGSAYGTGTGWGRGGFFNGIGGGTSGEAFGTYNVATAYGSSNAYGVYSHATLGPTTGHEYAFFGVGDGYFSGDVGIGTYTPGSKLTVSGGATVGSAYAADSLSDGNLAISGNVGIGTTTPVFHLDIRDGVSTYLGYFNNNNATDSAFGIQVRGDAYGSGTGQGLAGYFYGSGGSASGTAFGSVNYAFAYGSSTAYGVYSDAGGGTTTGREWAFYGLGDGYFSGNVGIGTEVPGYQLEVLDSQSYATAKFKNTSTSINADGISIEIGPTINPALSNDFLQFRDGNGTFVGYVNGNAAGGVNYTTLSDARLKTNIVEFAGGLDMVSRMKVKRYEFIEAPGKERIGFLAQELQTVFPQAVSGDPEGDVEEKPMGVDYGRVTPVLVSAIQEQTLAIQEQASTIQKLIAKNKALEKRLAILEVQLEK